VGQDFFGFVRVSLSELSRSLQPGGTSNVISGLGNSHISHDGRQNERGPKSTNQLHVPGFLELALDERAELWVFLHANNAGPVARPSCRSAPPGLPIVLSADS